VTGDASRSNEPAHPSAAIATLEVASPLNSLNESDAVRQRKRNTKKKKENRGANLTKLRDFRASTKIIRVDDLIFTVKHVNKFL